MRNDHIENEIEAMQLRKLEQSLYDMDFSESSNKKDVQRSIFKEMEGRKSVKINKGLRMRKVGVVVAATLSIFAVAQTTIAQEWMQKVIKVFRTDHIIVNQEERAEWCEMPVPENLKGKLYLQDGTEVEKLSPDMKALYTISGEKIGHIDIQTGEIVIEKELEAKRSETILMEYDINKINDYICFDAKMPTTLPEGYTFDRAEFYKGESGKVENSKYLDLYFKSVTAEKEIFVQERFADDETAYETGTDGTVEEVEINGVKAILEDGKDLDWEADGVLIGIHTKNNISKEQLITLAQAFQ